MGLNAKLMGRSLADRATTLRHRFLSHGIQWSREGMAGGLAIR